MRWSAWPSSWRTRSRVSPSSAPIASSVHGSPSKPKPGSDLIDFAFSADPILAFGHMLTVDDAGSLSGGPDAFGWLTPDDWAL